MNNNTFCPGVSYGAVCRTIASLYPNVLETLTPLVIPLSRDQSLIPQLFENIGTLYPELDRTDFSILYVAVVYRIYFPLVFLTRNTERSPDGIRAKMMKEMNWKDAPICNYYLNKGRVYIKGRSFKSKVETVIASVGLQLQNKVTK